MTPVVSVIIIFLNGERFLQEAIDSVFDQTLTEWELVLVDDGSTDGATGIAKRAAGERVRYLDHPGHENRGTSESRNAGLHAARGEFVLYLDADDILLPETLERLVGFMRAHPELGLAFGSTLWWFWAPEFTHKREVVQPYLGWAGRVLQPPRFLSVMTRAEDVHPANCSTILRRDAMLAVGGFDLEFRGMYEDTVLLAKMLLAYPCYATDEVLAAYRMHPSSQCHTALADGSYSMVAANASRERYLRWLKRYLAATGLGDRRLHLTLMRELWLYDRPRLLAVLDSKAVRRILAWLRGRFDHRAPDLPEDATAGEIRRCLQGLAAFYRRRGMTAELAGVEARLGLLAAR